MKVLCVLYDDPKNGMPKSYPLANLPKIEKYPDGMTLPSPKGRDFSPGELLGCVSGELGLRKFRYFPFDPAFPEYGQPQEAELVCCIDVLEHVEPFYLDAVLIDLRKITTGHGFFTIHTGPAIKTLPDGRNAHLIQKPASWWLPKLCDHFETQHLQQSPGGFWIVVSPKSGG